MGIIGPMWWTGIEAARAAGFEGFVKIGELRKTNLRDVPEAPGVYLVLRSESGSPTFLAASVGGRFKGRDPTVPCSLLIDRWVQESAVLYVGKAGGENSSTLRSRLKEFLRFGRGRPAGHWGGRYIWQVRDCESLLVCWKRTENDDARSAERALLDDFSNNFIKLPFANCRR